MKNNQTKQKQQQQKHIKKNKKNKKQKTKQKKKKKKKKKNITTSALPVTSVSNRFQNLGTSSQIIISFLLTGARNSFGFLLIGACSISSLRTFYICRDRRFVTIPANIKNLITNCVINILMSIIYIFISIKKFHKA